MKKISLITGLALLPCLAFGKIAIGEKAPTVVLNGKEGELLNGGGWNSNVIGGKVTVVMYVDPDKNSTNEHVEDSIRAHFTKADIKVFGVVNTAATIIPNFMLRRRLSAKQARNPLVNLVLDYDRNLEQKWGLKDDLYNVTVWDKEGKLFFLKEGVCDANDIKTILDGITARVKEEAAPAPVAAPAPETAAPMPEKVQASNPEP